MHAPSHVIIIHNQIQNVDGLTLCSSFMEHLLKRSFMKVLVLDNTDMGSPTDLVFSFMMTVNPWPNLFFRCCVPPMHLNWP